MRAGGAVRSGGAVLFLFGHSETFRSRFASLSSFVSGCRGMRTMQSPTSDFGAGVFGLAPIVFARRGTTWKFAATTLVSLSFILPFLLLVNYRANEKVTPSNKQDEPVNP